MDADVKQAFEDLKFQLTSELGYLKTEIREQARETQNLARLVGAIGASLGDVHSVLGDVAKQIQETNKRLDLIIPITVQNRTDEVQRYRTLSERIDAIERDVTELKRQK
jgi:hypothetical protein